MVFGECGFVCGACQLVERIGLLGFTLREQELPEVALTYGYHRMTFSERPLKNR